MAPIPAPIEAKIREEQHLTVVALIFFSRSLACSSVLTSSPSLDFKLEERNR